VRSRTIANTERRALIFAAGLILGFDMFAKKELDYEVETAFRSAKDVLDFLGIQSPQAAHYSGILTLLSDAVVKQRMKTPTRPRRKGILVKTMATLMTTAM
jgi:hypothetical protein